MRLASALLVALLACPAAAAPPEPTGDADRDRALAYLEAGNRLWAIKTLLEALEQTPNDLQTRTWAVWLLLQDGDLDRARHLLDTAEMAAEIHVVSPERIATEMRRLLADPNRAEAVRLMLETGLASELLPEIVIHDDQKQRLDETLAAIVRLGEPCGFPPALAALLLPFVDAAGATAVCGRWRLSNKETERVAWLVANHAVLSGARSMRWSVLQPYLIAKGIEDLLLLTEAISPEHAETVAYCRSLTARPLQELNPPPLLTGDDLLAHGVPTGPQYKKLLQCIRAAQLDGEVRTKAEAIAMVEEWIVDSG